MIYMCVGCESLSIEGHGAFQLLVQERLIHVDEAMTNYTLSCLASRSRVARPVIQ